MNKLQFSALFSGLSVLWIAQTLTIPALIAYVFDIHVIAVVFGYLALNQAFSLFYYGFLNTNAYFETATQDGVEADLARMRVVKSITAVIFAVVAVHFYQ